LEAHGACKNGEITEIAPAALEGTEITGKTLGLVGFGNIAQRAADMLRKGFDVEAICYDPYVSAAEAATRGAVKFDALAEVVSRADLVSVSVPLTRGTMNLISGDVFNHFKPSAFLVNASRGGIVNEQDLYRALTRGGLAGAACDVFAEEPPTGKNPLLSLPNFVATPHIGGCSRESLLRVGMECVDQVLSVIDGGTPLHPVP
ncbi:MAG: NAD(P)-dependent oxidoreductase, partial [Candidatus Methylomirabilota bacterium]